MSADLDPKETAEQLRRLLTGACEEMRIAPLVQSLGPNAAQFEPLIIQRLRELLSVPFMLPDPYDPQLPRYNMWTVKGWLTDSLLVLGQEACERAASDLTDDLASATDSDIREEIERTLRTLRERM